MMRQVVGGLAVLLLSALPAWAGATDYFTEFTKDFGTTPRGPVLMHYFAIKNTSQNPVRIGQPRVSCGCVSTKLMKDTLEPGESTAVLAMMDTRRIPQAGVLKQVIVYVPFLSPVLEEVSLKVQAIARDDLIMTPDTLAFGTVRKGQGGEASIKVTFTSDPSWEITSLSSTGVYVKPDAKLVSRANGAVTYEVSAKLAPECPVGDWTADIWLKTSNASIEKLRIPVRVTVVAPIALNPGVVQLNDLKLGNAIEHRVVLRANQAFKVLDVKGNDEVVELKTQSTEAMPVHVLTIAVKPNAMGPLNRTLEIITDHKEQDSIALPLIANVVR